MFDDVALPLADGRYELIRRIGVGGMATVYEGFDTRLQVKRAIKILDPSFLARKNIRTRFEAEARTMARLTHQHIVTVQDVGRDGDRAYIVMELIEGGSFSDLIDRHGPLSVVAACTGVADMLEALEFAHASGVVHRDVKPHNMLIAADGTAKLGDFGIAMLSADDARSTTRTGMSMGTPAYMPPEQMADTKSVGPTADIFAAGATLYTLITGREPNNIFATEVREEVLRDVPAEVAAVIRRATQYQPEDRYATAREMREALLEVIAHAPHDGDTQPRPRPRAVTPPPSHGATHWQLLDTQESARKPVGGRSPTVRAALIGGSAAIVVVLVGLIAVLAVGRATDARQVASANERGVALMEQAEAAGTAGDWTTASRLVDDALQIGTTDEQLIARESAFALEAHREMLVMSATAALSSGDLAEAERRARDLPDGDPDAAILLAEIHRRADPPATEPVVEPPVAAVPPPVIEPKPSAVKAPSTVASPPVAVPATVPVVVPVAITPSPEPVQVTVPAAVVPAAAPEVAPPDPAAVAAAARATLPERVRAHSLDDIKHALERVEYAAAKGGLTNAAGATTLLAEDLIGSFAPGMTFDIYPRALFDAIAASQGLPEAKVRGAVRRANHP